MRFYLRLIKRLILYPGQCIKMILLIMRINNLLEKKSISVIFYDRFAMHNSFTAPVLEEFIRLKGRAIYFVADKNHPALTKSPDYCEVYLVSRRYELLYRYLKVPFLVTPASAYDYDAHNELTKVAHIYHSMASMHFIYGDTAFDSYDIFFATGPHHTREFEQLSELRGWKNKVSFQAGYPKVDNIAQQYKQTEKNSFEKKVRVAFAPSWGKTNILDSHGYIIIKDLLEKNFKVVLRPHKHSFDFDREVINRIITDLKCDALFLDQSINFDNIYACDLMISDWSGIAYEFAFATSKPVVSVEVVGGQKIQSKDNVHIETKAMEDVCRYDIGIVASPEQVSAAAVELLNQESKARINSITSTRKKYLYNFGNSAHVIALQLIKLSGRKVIHAKPS
ncbi:hypothetical protein MNBD_GAMMA12-1274 [hydrothermal vent metagenome]|uniref:CDP-glycerol--glycerophosphate glycerophosphotransferase n=1 Tax=hydrothermal vent metagenome TaxID=652676 RepID=A0A3B0YQI2_9ZZZZ